MRESASSGAKLYNGLFSHRDVTVFLGVQSYKLERLGLQSYTDLTRSAELAQARELYAGNSPALP